MKLKKLGFSKIVESQHENSNFLLFPKSKRHIEILGKDFKFSKKRYYLKHLNISPFCGGSGRYREFFYKKI